MGNSDLSFEQSSSKNTKKEIVRCGIREENKL